MLLSLTYFNNIMPTQEKRNLTASRVIFLLEAQRKFWIGLSEHISNSTESLSLYPGKESINRIVESLNDAVQTLSTDRSYVFVHRHPRTGEKESLTILTDPVRMEEWIAGDIPLQTAFPEIDAETREFMLNGSCG